VFNSEKESSLKSLELDTMLQDLQRANIKLLQLEKENVRNAFNSNQEKIVYSCDSSCSCSNTLA
jgi:ferredoxin